MSDELKANDINSLFENGKIEELKKPKNNKEPKNYDNKDEMSNILDNDDTKVTPDIILETLNKVDKDNHTDAVIIADLSRIKNVTDDMTFDNIPEENREYIDQIVVEQSKFDMYTLDNNIFNITLKFDSAKDAYMKELNELLNRYRVMQEDLIEKGKNNEAIMLMFSFIPNELKGRGVLNVAFPISYFRILDDNNVNATFLMQFYVDNLQFGEIKIDDDVKSEIIADTMREMEEGTNGSLF